MSVKSPKNCIFCAINPLLMFTSFLGFSSFDYKCNHAKENTAYNMSKSRLKALLSLVTSFCMGIQITYMLFFQPIKDGLVDTLMHITDCILSVITFSLLTYDTFVITEYRMAFYHGVMFMVQRKTFEIDIFDVKTVKRLKYKSITSVVISFLCCVLHVILTKKYNSALVIYAYTMIGCCIAMDLEVHTIILTKNFENLKRVLTHGLVRNELIDSIRTSQRLYSCAIENIDIFNSCMSLLTMMGLLLTIVLAVIYIYILIIATTFKEYKLSRSQIVDAVTMLSLSCIPMIYDLVKIEKLATVSNDILSFLFRYPISKLTPIEAAQVEFLITTLIIQKPVVRPFNLFTVGTQLFASISGTVITYLLVALQFHLAWTKKQLNSSTTRAMDL